MHRQGLKRLGTVVLCVVLSGCASVVRNPLPEDLHRDASVLGGDEFRQWGDGLNPRVFVGIETQAELEAIYGGVMHVPHHYLVISGGGANGAYGAGVLKAWSEMGTRPEFTLVTGVSTGALTAPFAFLGSEYDGEMERLYTTLDTTRIINTRNVFSIFGADSIVDSSPLSRVLEEVVDEKMVARIAEEFRRGRTLLVGTTNLDAARPVVWNITRIAASGHPEAPRLVRQVLLASASIPGAFPPVYIEVEARNGQRYDEMHVDGGVSSQMFFYPTGVDWEKVTEMLDVQGTPHIHLIRNAFIHARYDVINPRLLPIAGRTIDSLIRTQGIGDFFRIFTLAKRDGLDLDVTWIPEEIHTTLGVEATEAFDPRYMNALFDYGYQRTLNGDTWTDFATLVESLDAVELTDE